MDKQTVIYPYYHYHGNKNKMLTHNMDKSQKHYASLKKSNTNIPYDTI